MADQFIFYDIYDHPEDLERLHRFYQDFMIPSFPLEDERDPVQAWEYLLSSKARQEPSYPAWHLLLLFDEQDIQKKNILAGCAFEHYPKSNCALLTYLVIHSDYRRQGLARRLMEQSLLVLKKDAQRRSHAADCKAIFAEMNSPDKIREDQDVMNPLVRLKIFHKLGLRKLNFSYIQPPLSPQQEKCKDLVLAIHPASQSLQKIGRTLCLPAPVLAEFLHEFYDYLCEYDFTSDPDFQDMMQKLKQTPMIAIENLVNG